MNYLKGVNVFITRPVEQAQELMKLVHAAGGHPLLLPMLKIEEVDDPRPLQSMLKRLSEFDLAIFISANAVNHVMNYMNANRWPKKVNVAAMGPSTAQALQKSGIKDIIVPDQHFDSESLLQKSELQQVSGKNIVIFRGQGGREFLGNALTKRGACISYAECYKRLKPEDTDLSLFASWTQANTKQAIIITSSEALRNLFEIAGATYRSALVAIPLFVSHRRIADTAQKLGAEKVILTAPGDQGLMEGLLDYFKYE